MLQTISNAAANGKKPAFPETEDTVSRGPSKREHFAAQMLAALLVDAQGVPNEMLACEAVKAADALLFELAKSEAFA